MQSAARSEWWRLAGHMDTAAIAPFQPPNGQQKRDSQRAFRYSAGSSRVEVDVLWFETARRTIFSNAPDVKRLLVFEISAKTTRGTPQP